MTKDVYESDVSIPGFEHEVRCPHCGGEIRIVMGERLGTMSVPIDLAPELEVPTQTNESASPRAQAQ